MMDSLSVNKVCMDMEEMKEIGEDEREGVRGDGRHKTYGRGMLMETSLSSMFSCSSSYSMFTSHPLLVSFGQQFTAIEGSTVCQKRCQQMAAVYHSQYMNASPCI